MRSTTRMILPLLAIMAAFVLIVFMLARIVRLDYGVLAGSLYHLKHDHAELANAVLRVQQGHHEDVSTIVTAKDQVIADAQQLTELNWRDHASDTELRALLDAYSQSVGELLDHVEQFKTANAVEHNSLHYLPQLAESIKALVANDSREVPLAVESVLWAIAVHMIEDNAASHDDVIRKLQDLGPLQAAAPESVAEKLKLLIHHVAKILETQPLVDSHLDAIVTSPADQYLTEALLAVAKKSDHVLDRQQLLQLALIVTGAMLVGYIAALLWLLRLSVRELNSANLVLEEKIEKRIAEVKLKNQQLLQAQKLESIGQLAAGIAHEINTPMQFVYDNLEFLSECSDKLFEVVEVYDRNLNVTGPQRSWEERSAEVARVAESTRFEHVRAETPKAIRESLEGIQRVINIVRAMREFSHPGQEEQVGVNLNNAVHTTATMSRNRWKDIAEMEFDLDPDLPTLRCVPAEVNQLLLNLVVNAADAIAEKLGSNSGHQGTITVRTRCDSGLIVLEVADTGCGIPPDIRNRIFDPFFTTKDPGKGTGQGLSICYNVVVKKLRGSIDVQSTPGEGTRFTVTIPIPPCNNSQDIVEPSSDGERELELQGAVP